VRSHYEALGRYGTIGLELILSILFGFFGGRWLDGKLGTHGWLTWIGFGFGVAAGFRAIWDTAKRLQRETEAADERERHERRGERGDHGRDDGDGPI
jgi:hypothetical protein